MSGFYFYDRRGRFGKELRNKMIVIAHRGAWFNGDKIKDIIYQNTMQSFRDADDSDLDAVEADIRKCACGALLLSHDEFSGCACKRLATLQDLLPLGEWMDVHLEIKEKGLAADVLRLTLPLRHEQAIIYSSFKWSELLKIKRLHGRARIALLLGKDEIKIPKFLVLLAALLIGAESIHIDIELIKDNQQLVAYFRSKGFTVRAYTVNEIDEIMLSRKLDLDGIFTDYPQRAIKFLSMAIH